MATMRRNSGNSATLTHKEDEKSRDLLMAGDGSIISMFQNAAIHLTERQDRHEKIVRQSRDVCIESKRIIFLLHSPETKQNPKEKIITEAKQRFHKLKNSHIKVIAMEMAKTSAYLHYRPTTPGLQEFVEARTLLSVMEEKKIVNLSDVRNELKFTKDTEDSSESQVSTVLGPADYMLGLADLSGEIMRRAIYEIPKRDFTESMFARNMLRNLYSGFACLDGATYRLNNKLKTTRRNMHKVEIALTRYYFRRGLCNLKALPQNKDCNQQPVKKAQA